MELAIEPQNHHIYKDCSDFTSYGCVSSIDD